MRAFPSRAHASANAFVYTTLPAKLARKILEQLNKAGPSKFVPETPRTIQEEDDRVERMYAEWIDAQNDAYDADLAIQGEHTVFGGREKQLTMGYVTHDACPGRGDDIEHVPCELCGPILAHKADGSAPLGQDPVSAGTAARGENKLTTSDFISTAFPEGLEDDDELDVIVMDFALDDFRACHDRGP